MKREKFFYNRQTLQYERIKLSLKEKFTRFFGYASAVFVSSLIITFIGWYLFPSPKEEVYLKEIETLGSELHALSNDFNDLSKGLAYLQERDNGIYRMVLEMDPIDENIWEGGIGGARRYSELYNFSRSGDLMAEVRQKVDKIKRQYYILTTSQDEIEEMAVDKEEMLSSIPSIKPIRSDKLNRGVQLLSGFGYRTHPIHKIVRMHAGIDFSAPQGTSIQATGNGVVVQASSNKGGYGIYVVIDHGYGYQTLYGHMSKIEVKVGQKVKKGQEIGKVGSTGTSTAPHCHYEVHYKGKAVNPIDYVMDGLTPAEYQELVRLSEMDNQSFD